ncbi:glycoprotein-N-acetylgalactosamine 3-beta-galactosyltransferase 1-like [Ptychodera flava]|uniref:glycoprotein-N-acetylgalactosamine 3-beta-galactosyltransferase 1-like n=1 Tax=Ptychodera flava TaxID=63121 RepID=UPI00396A22E9
MLFFSSETNENQTLIGLNVTEGRHFLWGKVKAAFKYIYEHHINDADWFMKADGDTYVIVENLRKMLERENTTQLMLFGDRVRNPNNLNVTHADGGAGYVISKATLRKLVEIGLKNASLCSQQEQGNEDVTMSRCLERLGVPHRDSRDEHGKQRFFRISVETYFNMSVSKYKRKIEYYPTVQSQVPKFISRPSHAKVIRILCFIPTSPNNDERLTAVRDTWGKRCDKMLFFSSETNQNQTVIGLNVTEGYKYLWGKVKAAFKYIYEHHINDADWFMKADDDTYVIVENLRNMLEQEDTTQLTYFGRKFILKNNTKLIHIDGGAGYVMSKAVLKKLVEIGLENPSLCRQPEYGPEDVTLARCLKNLGVSHGDSRDEYGKQRFFRIPLDAYFKMTVPEGVSRVEYYPSAEVFIPGCWSHYVILNNGPFDVTAVVITAVDRNMQSLSLLIQPHTNSRDY